MTFARTAVRRGGWLFVLLGAALALALTGLPSPGETADHLDAPALNPGNLGADINDLYAFQGATTTNTVLAMTVSPAAGAIGPGTFPTDVIYQFNVFDGSKSSPIADAAYRVTFAAPDADGRQQYTLRKATGADADGHSNTGTVIAEGKTNSLADGDTDTSITGSKFFAGLRSDPFFFDLAGFQGTLEGVSNGRMLGDGKASDFFANLNVLAIVLELPDSELPNMVKGNGIGVWASTANASSPFAQLDRMGRPAINTVVNANAVVDGNLADAITDADKTQASAQKTAVNTAHPKDDSANFTTAAANALTALSSIDKEGSYSMSQLGTLAGILLPDVLKYAKDGTLPPPLNGRPLAADVIDTELRIVTGGDPLNLFGGARDADGAINSDGVGPHTDYLTAFPYLGRPHGKTLAKVDPVGVVDQDQGLWYIMNPTIATLSGANEVPAGSGDPNGSGRAVLALNEKSGKVCFTIDLSNVQGTVTGAHIHTGAAGANGNVVVDLDYPNTKGTGCVTSTQGQLDAILKAPGDYYVNVHSNLYPSGAVRGQITGGLITPFFFGNPADVPIFGDWNGDGTATPGMFRQSDGKVYLRNSNTAGPADIEFFFGNPGDIPLAGDWDGDGDDTVSIYRPSNQTVYVINKLGSANQGLGAADSSFVFGDPGDRPFVGDWDGDNKDGVALHRISTGRVYGKNALTTGVADFDYIYGDPNDSVFGGDWNGDGKDTPSLFRPSDGVNYLRNSLSQGIADMEIFTDGFESGDTSAWTSSK